MLIKTLLVHSLPYVLAVASSIVANHSDFGGSASVLQHSVSKDADIFAGQIVNRAMKSGRLLIKSAPPQAKDKAPVRIPMHCGPPTDVLGRCFAHLKVNLTGA